jgi:nitrite reductase/ring-hydroxylating ferredoxin subunit
MFKTLPKIFAHISSLDKGNFVLHDTILNKSEDGVNMFHRFCPHRMYPLHNTGDHVENIICKFHNFEWDRDGNPINNPKKLKCGTAEVGKSGLIFKDFVEPDHKWVKELASETELVYSHSFHGESKGSWLWLMDAEADLLHVYKGGIHPFLSQQIDLKDITMEQGDGWILQDHPLGWWLYVYPFTFVEYGRPGCVMVNTIMPDDINTEYGFKWISQYYYKPSIHPNNRIIFEMLETVFKEDVATIELQKGDYFPLMKGINKYEDHCLHFGEWIRKNKIK